MEHLTKQQIVLLTLLVSFVTSIATGIVTVSLVDQAPEGVTSTINHVIERTIEQVAPASADTGQAAVINSGVGSDTQGQITTAIATVEKNIVIIKSATGVNAGGQLIGSTTGMGLIVSSTGSIVADKSSVANVGSSYIGVFPGGQIVPLQITQSQNNGDLVFLSPMPSAGAQSPSYVPAVFPTALPKLGQTVIALSGGDTTAVNQGIISSVDVADSSFITTIDITKSSTATVLFDTSGNILGIQSVSATIYPYSVIKGAVPQ